MPDDTTDYGFGGYDLGGYSDLGSDYGLDFGSGDVPYDPSLDYGNNSGQTSGFSWGNFAKAIADQFKGTGYGGQLGQLAAFGGLATLLNKIGGQQSQQPVGYQGGIPEYTISRGQTPLAQQRPADYRPGQGGITYFQPTQYTATGKTLGAATPGQVVGGGITGGAAGAAATGGSGTTTGTAGGVSALSAVTDQQIFDVGKSLLQQGVSPQTILDKLATVTGATQAQINKAAEWLRSSGYTGLNVPGSKSTIPTRVTRDTADTGGGGTSSSPVLPPALQGKSQEELARIAASYGMSLQDFLNYETSGYARGQEAERLRAAIAESAKTRTPEQLVAELEKWKANPPKNAEELRQAQIAWNDYTERYANSTWNYANMGGKPKDYSLKPVEYLSTTYTQFSDPINRLLSDLSAESSQGSKGLAQLARKQQISLLGLEDTLKKYPVISDILGEVYKLDPTYKASDTDIMRLRDTLRTASPRQAMRDFLADRKNLIGATVGEGPQDMSNPLFAKYQQAINQLRSPVAAQQDWESNATKTSGRDAKPAVLWRDPKTGYGIGVGVNRYGTAGTLTYYDQSGQSLGVSTLNAADLYRNAEVLGIDLSNIGDLGRKLEAKGIGYKPYDVYRGTGSDAGIDFDDIARGGLGTAYDWTVDTNAAQKSGLSAQLAAKDIALAERLGLLKYSDVTRGGGVDPSRFAPITTRSGETRGFVVYSPLGGGMGSWHSTASEAAEAAKNYPGATVYDLSKDTLPGLGAPKAGVSAPGGIETLKADQAVTRRLAQALKESMAQGFTLEQTKQGAMQKLGVTEAQFDAAVKAAGLAPGGASGGLGSIIRRGYAMGGGVEMLAKGRYLKGNGDGVSDSIPAKFAGSGQPAALADGEFVVPARVVSELGNGSSDAGARKLYAMLDRVEQRARKAKRGKPSGADRELNKLA